MLRKHTTASTGLPLPTTYVRQAAIHPSLQTDFANVIPSPSLGRCDASGDVRLLGMGLRAPPSSTVADDELPPDAPPGLLLLRVERTWKEVLKWRGTGRRGKRKGEGEDEKSVEVFNRN